MEVVHTVSKSEKIIFICITLNVCYSVSGGTLMPASPMEKKNRMKLGIKRGKGETANQTKPNQTKVGWEVKGC